MKKLYRENIDESKCSPKIDFILPENVGLKIHLVVCIFQYP